MSSMEIQLHSILILSSDGTMGSELMQAFNRHDHNCHIHAFCDDPSSLPTKDYLVAKKVHRGSISSKEAIEKAIQKSDADVVIVNIGIDDEKETAPTTKRTDNAQIVTNILQGNLDVRVVVISSLGAGKSTIRLGLGVGAALKTYMKHRLEDHTGQEQEFLEKMGDRTVIVRPTTLTEGKSTGSVKILEEGSWCSWPMIDKQDLAVFISNEVLDGDGSEKVVNVTGAKAK